MSLIIVYRSSFTVLQNHCFAAITEYICNQRWRPWSYDWPYYYPNEIEGLSTTWAIVKESNDDENDNDVIWDICEHSQFSES